LRDFNLSVMSMTGDSSNRIDAGGSSIGIEVAKPATRSGNKLVDSSLREGDLVGGKYRIERRLGIGGMGEVVAARHITIGAKVAIKILLSEMLQYPEVLQRFTREARAACALQSDHVCRTTDVGELKNGAPYIVMELLGGMNLSEYIMHRGPMPEHVAIGFALQALDAISEAHEHGIVHRDLKPVNLFLARRGSCVVVKVLDFGIATSRNATDDVRLTKTHALLGTASYMSPEQIRAARAVDARSDVWAMGVTLYELVSGRLPFIGENALAIAYLIAAEPHPPLTNVSAQFAAIIDRSLAKDPGRRFQTAAEFAAALTRVERLPVGSVSCGCGSDQRGRDLDGATPVS